MGAWLQLVRREQSCVPGSPSHRVTATQVGWYSNVSRGKRRQMGEAAGVAPADVESSGTSRTDRDETRDARALRRSWAQLIKRIYEVDPLVCPSCGSEMKVIAFITEREVVNAILRYLKRAEERRQRAPPG